MASDKFVLGSDNSSFAKSAAKFIRDGMRKGGSVGIVEQPPLRTTSTGGGSPFYPPVGMTSFDTSGKSTVKDLITGDSVTQKEIRVIYPCLSLLPPKYKVDTNSTGHLVYYGTYSFLQKITQQN